MQKASPLLTINHAGRTSDCGPLFSRSKESNDFTMESHPAPQQGMCMYDREIWNN